MLIPYMVFCIGTFLLFNIWLFPNDSLKSILASFVRSIIFTGAPRYNIALWFLPTLFIVRIVFNKFNLIGLKPIVIWLVSAIVVIIICSLKYKYGDVWLLCEPYYLFNSFVGLFFFSAGVCLRGIQFEKYLIVGTAILYVIITITYYSFVDMFPNSLLEGSYLLWLASSLSGCIIVNNLFKWLSKLYSFPVLNYLGVNSMTFLVLHMWVVLRTIKILPIFGVNEPFVQMFVIVLSCGLFCYLANLLFHTKYLLWVIGEGFKKE